MIMSDATLKTLLDCGELVIEPLAAEAIQPASIDLRLGPDFLVLEDNNIEVITLDSEIKYRSIEADCIIIPPKSFVLATTLEFIKVPSSITAFVEGRSSIGRIGLFIENAGWVDPGFEGQITLELFNASSLPIRLQSGRRICQLVFCRMDRAALRPYCGKYQGQRGSTGSRIFLDD